MTHRDSIKCDCSPEVYVLCQQCGGSKAGCWNCEHGLNEWIEAEHGFDIPLIVVHNPHLIEEQKKAQQ